jgi:hypothetical protein
MSGAKNDAAAGDVPFEQIANAANGLRAHQNNPAILHAEVRGGNRKLVR